MTSVVTIGNATLYHGNCMDILPCLPEVDACVTDPPYGHHEFSMDRTGGCLRKYNHIGVKFADWDYVPDEHFWLTIKKLSKHQIIWGGNYFAKHLGNNRCFLIWDKKNIPEKFSMGMCEYAWCSMNQNSKIYACVPQDFQRFHPTQKPLRLMKWCIALLEDAETILDPFMGSGTTGVACYQLQKKFIGIEKEKVYFDKACERIYEESKQLNLL